MGNITPTAAKPLVYIKLSAPSPKNIRKKRIEKRIKPIQLPGAILSLILSAK